MPQFDFTTLFSVTVSVGLCWAVYYSFFSITLLSDIVVLTKFRGKVYAQNLQKSLKGVVLPSIFLYKSLVLKSTKF